MTCPRFESAVFADGPEVDEARQRRMMHLLKRIAPSRPLHFVRLAAGRRFDERHVVAGC
jgi:hypothetical protein